MIVTICLLPVVAVSNIKENKMDIEDTDWESSRRAGVERRAVELAADVAAAGLKGVLAGFIFENHSVGFGELEAYFKIFLAGGNRRFVHRGHENIIIWEGMSDQGYETITALLKAGTIHMALSTVQARFRLWRRLPYPVIKQVRKSYLSSPHWYPVALRPYSKRAART
jgi:hypothetical protein